MVASLVYSVIRILVDVMVTSRSEEAELQAEVLALRRQVQVLERQIKRVRWSPADRMILAALRERLPRSAWAGLLVRPETVLGWHRARWCVGSGQPIEVGPGGGDRRSPQMSASSSSEWPVRTRAGVTSGCEGSC